MNQNVNVLQQRKESNTKEQLEQHLAQEPESALAAHRWMKHLEIVGFIVSAMLFGVALYLSINWKNIDPAMIAVAWFAFAASGGLHLIFYGLDAIFLRAFPTMVNSGKSLKFVTGSGAVWIGVGFILFALGLVAFWGVFAYATWTHNFELMRPLINLLGVGMGVAIVVSKVQKTVSKLAR
jgi:hypothetical protein